MTFLTHDTNFLRRELFLTPKTKRLNTLRALRSLWKRLVLHKKTSLVCLGKRFLTGGAPTNFLWRNAVPPRTRRVV